MKMFKNDGEEHIPADNPIEINLERALREVDKFPTVEENFIGFINEKDETINFIRFEENGWFLDVPILEEYTYSYSLQDDDLTTEAVKGVIKRFFRGEDWKPLCNLRSSKRKPPSDKTKRRIEFFREVGDEGAEFTSEEILSKEEFINKLEGSPRSTDDTTYGIIAELSKPFVMIKNPNGKWEAILDLENPNIDIEISEDEKEYGCSGKFRSFFQNFLTKREKIELIKSVRFFPRLKSGLNSPNLFPLFCFEESRCRPPPIQSCPLANYDKQDCLICNDKKELKRVLDEFAEFLYSLRSKFVHDARMFALASPESVTHGNGATISMGLWTYVDYKFRKLKKPKYKGGLFLDLNTHHLERVLEHNFKKLLDNFVALRESQKSNSAIT